ncbi:MAG: DUF3343 domain-containing protein [Clostridia bacterium]|nr:DUF3343 domain-containing protein [Clostridia bacterium]
MESRIIVIGTNTTAIKARRILSSDGIAARTVRVSRSSEGCRYGVEVYSRDLDRALMVLHLGGVEYSGVI